MQDTESITIQLDKPRKLALPLGSLKRAQTEVNKVRQARGEEPHSIFWIIDDLLKSLAQNELDVEILMIVLWAALSHEDKELTIADLDEMSIQIFDCTNKLTECINVWMRAPKTDESGVGDAATPLAQPQLNGSTSGPVVAST